LYKEKKGHKKMKFYKTILFTVLLFASLSKYSYSQDIPKPKKEILISINSTYYKNAKEVVEGFFKQANIRNKSIDSSLEKVDQKNFSFVGFTVEETMEYLSLKYNIVFKVQSVGKNKIYDVEVKK
jgi:hypothetical protein